MLEQTLSKKLIDHKDSQVIRGKLQFAQGQMHGRVSKLCLNEISRLCVVGRHKLDPGASTAIRRYLRESKPRVLERRIARPLYVFTDACFDPSNKSWPAGIGGVLISEGGEPIEFFSHGLSMSWNY